MFCSWLILYNSRDFDHGDDVKVEGGQGSEGFVVLWLPKTRESFRKGRKNKYSHVIVRNFMKFEALSTRPRVPSC